MKNKDFLQLYRADSLVQTLLQRVVFNAENPVHLHLRGVVGSLDAVLAAVCFLDKPQTQVFILHEKEEAAYFLNDLQNLLPDTEILFFPTSYRKPYQFEETDNARLFLRNLLKSKPLADAIHALSRVVVKNLPVFNDGAAVVGMFRKG